MHQHESGCLPAKGQPKDGQTADEMTERGISRQIPVSKLITVWLLPENIPTMAAIKALRIQDCSPGVKFRLGR